MDLPAELRKALEIELGNQSPAALSKAAAALSLRYRHQHADGRSLLHSINEIQAYAAFRMPATYAAVHAVLEQVRAVQKFNPNSLLDIGTGPGTVMWAAAELYPDLKTIILIERESEMIALGKRLAKHSTRPVMQHAHWVQADVTRDWKVPVADLVTAAYVLGELDPKDRQALVQQLWQVTAGTLVLIAPGTPGGFACIRSAREQLLAAGGVVVAPCPHNLECPIVGDDWCHFAQRVARTRLHRQLKAGDLAYEDEKYAYLAVSRQPGAAVSGRIIRHPQIRKGHVTLSVCEAAGISSRTISRKDKELYRQVKNLKWGSIFPGEASND